MIIKDNEQTQSYPTHGLLLIIWEFKGMETLIIDKNNPRQKRTELSN